MNIALFGGAFNPPHIGHVLVARQVIDYMDIDSVWFVPTNQATWGKSMVPISHRLAMTKLLHVQGAEVSDLEFRHPIHGRTIDLLPYLPKGHSYVFLMGSDQLPMFHAWKQYQQLLQQLPFIVFFRPGFPVEPLFPNMTVITHKNMMVSDISSTKIRNRLAGGFAIDPFVPPSVVKYIRKHKLYQKL